MRLYFKEEEKFDINNSSEYTLNYLDQRYSHTNIYKESDLHFYM